MTSFSFVETLESRRLLAAGFQIQLAFESSVSSAVKTVIQNAANKWQSIITGDIPDVGAGSWGAAVDDIRITARVKAIDGAGKGLAQARPTAIRSTGKLPIAGEIEIDSADVSNSSLQSVVIHEIAHALGFGTIWSQFPALRSGVGGSNPLFLGANALREYRAYARNTTLTGVPLENTSVVGTRDVHWRETTFGNELLTGFVGTGSNPLSRITIGQFADLGYQVNYNAAESYTLPGVTPATGSISGKVFTDKDNDKTYDASEPGVANRTVYLDLDNDGALSSSDARATTDSSGNYKFSGLAVGTYKIRIVRDGLTQTYPANNYGLNVTLSAGQAVSNQNFATIGGTTTPATGAIGGRVYNDVNKNAVIDTGDVGLAGKTVYVDANNNGVKDGSEVTSVTDSTGRYNFPNLVAGTYNIRLVRGTLTQLSPSNNGARVVNLGTGSVLSSQNFGTSGGVAARPTSSAFSFANVIALPASADSRSESAKNRDFEVLLA